MYLPQWVTAAVAVIQATTGPTNPIDALDNNHADNHGNNHPREVSFTATVPGRGFILALGADKAEEGQIVELINYSARPGTPLPVWEAVEYGDTLYTVLQLKGSELCAALPTEHKDGKETSISDKLHLKPCPTAPEPPEDDTQDQNNDDDKLPAAFIWDITQPKLGAITDITSAVGGVTIVYNKATLDTRGAIEMTEGYEYKFKFVPPA